MLDVSPARTKGKKINIKTVYTNLQDSSVENDSHRSIQADETVDGRRFAVYIQYFAAGTCYSSRGSFQQNLTAADLAPQIEEHSFFTSAIQNKTLNEVDY